MVHCACQRQLWAPETETRQFLFWTSKNRPRPSLLQSTRLVVKYTSTSASSLTHRMLEWVAGSTGRQLWLFFSSWCVLGQQVVAASTHRQRRQAT